LRLIFKELVERLLMAPLKITVRHPDESQNLIKTMTLWEIAGQARNDDSSFLEAPLI
jgi:hypothetical protein